MGKIELKVIKSTEKSAGFFVCLFGGGAMPTKPKKPCSYPGCPNLTVGTFCLEHQKKTAKDYNKYQRATDYNKRYDSKWRKIRAQYVQLHPLCECCLKEGRYIPVEEVHHILPLERGGTNDFSNLMSLCKSCHNKIHIALGDRHVHEN